MGTGQEKEPGWESSFDPRAASGSAMGRAQGCRSFFVAMPHTSKAKASETVALAIHRSAGSIEVEEGPGRGKAVARAASGPEHTRNTLKPVCVIGSFE